MNCEVGLVLGNWLFFCMGVVTGVWPRWSVFVTGGDGGIIGMDNGR